MKELVVLGFASRELAEEARSVGAELDRDGVLQLDGAALAYRRDDGRVELVQPMRLAPVGAASGAAAGGVLGLLLLEPVLFAAVGAVAGAAGAGLSALGLNQWFLRQLNATVAPRRRPWPPARRSPDPAGTPAGGQAARRRHRCRGWRPPARVGSGSGPPTRPPGPATTSPGRSRLGGASWAAHAGPHLQRHQRADGSGRGSWTHGSPVRLKSHAAG